MAKVAIYGAGRLGRIIAEGLLSNTKCDPLVLVDPAAGQAERTADALRAERTATEILVQESLDGPAAHDAAVAIIAAGRGGFTDDESPGELVEGHGTAVAEISRAVSASSPDAVIVLTTSPIAVNLSVAHQQSGFTLARVLGPCPPSPPSGADLGAPLRNDLAAATVDLVDAVVADSGAELPVHVGHESLAGVEDVYLAGRARVGAAGIVGPVALPAHGPDLVRYARAFHQTRATSPPELRGGFELDDEALARVVGGASPFGASALYYPCGRLRAGSSS